MDVLVIPRIQVNIREDVIAIFHLVLVRQMESIGSHDKQIVGGFHRQETHTVNAYAGSPVEQRHRRSHGCFQLDDRLARRIGRIDGLVIANHRKRKHAIICGQLGLQSVNTHPDAVRVKIRMLFDVLRIILIVRMHLAHLTQHQAAGRLVPHDMPALAISWSTFCDLDHEWRTGIFEVLRQRARRTCAEIVGIRDEQVFEALLLEDVQ